MTRLIKEKVSRQFELAGDLFFDQAGHFLTLT